MIMRKVKVLRKFKPCQAPSLQSEMAKGGLISSFQGASHTCSSDLELLRIKTSSTLDSRSEGILPAAHASQ